MSEQRYCVFASSFPILVRLFTTGGSEESGADMVDVDGDIGDAPFEGSESRPWRRKGETLDIQIETTAFTMLRRMPRYGAKGWIVNFMKSARE